jgi:hypothetical protein
MNLPEPPTLPEGLLNWSGHRSGGVRRLFDSTSGRPTGSTLRTRLLDRLDAWATALAGDTTTPRAILLVGGPGNGKTEAIEFTISRIDQALGLSGKLCEELSKRFLAADGSPVPRLAKIGLAELSSGKWNFSVSVVQDASADDAETKTSAAGALVADLDHIERSATGDIYLACVNRGILDDALILATDNQALNVRRVLETIVRAVGMGATAPACWPLGDFPKIAVWPMDVESLIANTVEDGIQGAAEKKTTAEQLLDLATNAERWPSFGSCAAGQSCPFCISRNQLATEPYRSSLLRVLHDYELASGKRWSFRDLFSLLSYLLAGMPPNQGKAATYNPCKWAASLSLIARQTHRPDAAKLRAPYLLLAAQYQHALFGKWPTIGVNKFRRDLSDASMLDDAAFMGLYHFLFSAKSRSGPPTLEEQLTDLHEKLDPAIADSDMEVAISGNTTIKYLELDIRFSQSISEGLTYIQRYRCLTPIEIDVLRALGASEQKLIESDVARIKPTTVSRIRGVARDFACRLVRRSIGMRAARVRDADILDRFRLVASGDLNLLHDASKQVDTLLNSDEKFVVNLNTTFGEPVPPPPRRAALTTSRQKIRILKASGGERPESSIRFLAVGTGSSEQRIPLTYDLFKSASELRNGMAPASLPRTVVALLDTTRARLAGQVVRDQELLDGSEIHIGTTTDVVAYEFGQFLIRNEGNDVS